MLQSVKTFIRRQQLASKKGGPKTDEPEEQASQSAFSGETALNKKGPVEPLDAKHMGDLLAVAASLKNNVPG